MEYRRLGRSGLKVSAIALGSWQTYGGSVGEEQAAKCIEHAYELGVNYFDTANNYNGGRAEEIVGRTLKNYPRESYVVATKGFHPKGEGPNERGLSRKYIMEQVNRSLQRLQMDYVDIFFCHKFDDETPLDESLRAIDDLVAQGKILYPGVSKWSVEEMELALAISRELYLDPIIADQPLYNMLEREIEREVMPFCREKGMGIVVFSPLAQGLLTGKYSSLSDFPLNSRAAQESARKHMNRLLKEANIRTVQALKPLAEEKQCSLSQLALAWVLKHNEISSAIIGASRPEQVEENVRALEITLTDVEMNRIRVILEHEKS